MFVGEMRRVPSNGVRKGLGVSCSLTWRSRREEWPPTSTHGMKGRAASPNVSDGFEDEKSEKRSHPRERHDNGEATPKSYVRR